MTKVEIIAFNYTVQINSMTRVSATKVFFLLKLGFVRISCLKHRQEPSAVQEWAENTLNGICILICRYTRPSA